MASAGGHWMKASVGPNAGSMVFVPAVKAGWGKESGFVGGQGYYSDHPAVVQGGLAVYQKDNGDWVVAHNGSGQSLGPAFKTEAGALTAMEELNQMGGKLWTQDSQDIKNTPGLVDAGKNVVSKYQNASKATAEAEMDYLKENYSINQTALQKKAATLSKQAETLNATQAAKPAAEPASQYNKANPSDYHGSAGDAIIGINVDGGGKIAYNKSTGKYDLIDKDGDVVGSNESLATLKDTAGFGIEYAATVKAGQAAQAASQPEAAAPSATKGKLTQPVPQGASQFFKDNAQDVEVTYKMGKTTTKAGVSLDVGHPDGKPSVTYNEKTGKYHANDINGKTLSTHDTFNAAADSIAHTYAPKIPTGAYSSAPKASINLDGGKSVEGVKVAGDHLVVFDQYSGNYKLVTNGGATIATHTTFEAANSQATNIEKYGGGNNYAWADQMYGSVSNANTVLHNHGAAQTSQMTQAEHSALSSYQDGGYGKINDYLWKGQSVSAAVKGKVNKIASAMKKGEGLPANMVLERKKHATSSLAKLIDNMQVGDVYHSKGYDSTSIKKNMWGGSHAIKYNAPKGLPGFYMNSKGYHSSHSSEFEFLIAAGAKWRVVNKYANEYGGTTIDVDFIGFGD